MQNAFIRSLNVPHIVHWICAFRTLINVLPMYYVKASLNDRREKSGTEHALSFR